MKKILINLIRLVAETMLILIGVLALTLILALLVQSFWNTGFQVAEFASRGLKEISLDLAFHIATNILILLLLLSIWLGGIGITVALLIGASFMEVKEDRDRQETHFRILRKPTGKRQRTNN